MRRLLPIAVSLAFLLFGCATTQPSRERVPTLPEARIREVESLIDSGSFLQSLEGISFLRSVTPTSDQAAKIDALEGRALEALASAFKQAAADKKYADAIRIYQSANAYGKPELVTGWTEKALTEGLASSLDSSGERLLSLLARLRAISLGEPTQAELSDALSYASGLGDAAAVRMIADLMVKRGFSIPAGIAVPKPDDKADFKRMIKGTVTVWVDRGIRMEKGVGYPDRVIGSAFFIDSRGYLLTNYHVIKSEVDPKYEGYSRLFIRLSEDTGDKIPAKVIGYDSTFDLALLKVELAPEYVFSGLSTEPVVPGDRIYAIGSPGGLEKTITSGIVSATGRRFLQMGDTLQVDVPLNPGNSGGPLLNDKGDVIGIVFAGIPQFEGINFAVPYTWIERVLPQLYAGGQVDHPWLGMSLNETDKGLEVTYVVPGEPADKAGILVGDIIEGINGAKYTTIRDAQDALLNHAPLSLVRLSSIRDGVKLERVLCLSSRPESPVEVALKRDSMDTVIYPLFGMQLERVGSFLWKNDYVVRRVSKGSVADESGFSENDPLTIQDWQVDRDKGYVVLQLYVKKRKQGFMESVIQIATYLDTNNFL
jgi:serine protease Do